MPAKNPASRHSLKSDLGRVDAHRIRKSEYEELPELTEELLARAQVHEQRDERPANEVVRSSVRVDQINLSTKAEKHLGRIDLAQGPGIVAPCPPTSQTSGTLHRSMLSV